MPGASWTRCARWPIGNDDFALDPRHAQRRAALRFRGAVEPRQVVLSGGADDLSESGWSGEQEVVFAAMTSPSPTPSERWPTSMGSRPIADGHPEGSHPPARSRTARPSAAGAGQAVEVLEFVKVRPTMESLFIQAVERAGTPTEPHHEGRIDRRRHRPRMADPRVQAELPPRHPVHAPRQRWIHRPDRGLEPGVGDPQSDPGGGHARAHHPPRCASADNLCPVARGAFRNGEPRIPFRPGSAPADSVWQADGYTALVEFDESVLQNKAGYVVYRVRPGCRPSADRARPQPGHGARPGALQHGIELGGLPATQDRPQPRGPGSVRGGRRPDPRRGRGGPRDSSASCSAPCCFSFSPSMAGSSCAAWWRRNPIGSSRC